VAVGTAHIDLLVVLPLNGRYGIAVPESEDVELRDAMNDRLIEVISTDEYALFTNGSSRIVRDPGNARSASPCARNCCVQSVLITAVSVRPVRR